MALPPTPKMCLYDLASQGVCFHIEPIIACGTYPIGLGAEHVYEYLHDPAGFLCKIFNMTRSEWIEYQESECCVFCSAYTAKKRRCRNFVTGGSMVDPHKWKAMQGEYCAVHAGETDHFK